RVGQLGRAISQLVERAEANAANGVRPPYFAYDFVISEAGKLTTGAPFDDGPDNALWADGNGKIAALAEAGAIDEAAAAALRDKLSTALKTGYLPGYQQLIAFMQKDRPNALTVATGVSGLPDGEAYYLYRVRASTTTELTPDEISS